MLYLWIGILVAAVVIEALTSDFVAIWFFPAALVSMVLSLFDLPVWLQMLVFVVVGLALVIATRPLCRKFLKPGNEKTNVDAIIGKSCIVTEEIRNIDEVGEVKVGGLCWSARSEENRVIAVGETVTVTAVQGVKLIVK
ncbi:MAG: NfeD family protein [Ruminococcaceae bacterium]|nr:NfeD family protein [Oscillospiraceae bacterium]